jgi:hypothetical protein
MVAPGRALPTPRVSLADAVKYAGPEVRFLDVDKAAEFTPGTPVEVLFPGDKAHFSSRPEAPLTEAEKIFRYHCRADNPFARDLTPAYHRWAEEGRAAWAARRAEKDRVPQ